MSDRVKTFWVEPLRRARLTLRRYAYESIKGGCKEHVYHDAHLPLFDLPQRLQEFTEGHKVWHHDGPQNAEDVPPGYAFPTHCSCGYEFQPDDEKQVFSESLYQSVDGTVYTVNEFPPGAMWDAEWYGDHARGSDGIHLMVRLPNRSDWCVDSRCSNCTMPDDKTHACWVRHGNPKTDPVTVDKNGHTCQAGAGSIIAGGWHGFLREGYLVGC